MDVHYRDTGTGQPLVLLHGTASSLHTWEDWTRSLDSSYRVIRPDLPAFGLTGPDPRDRYHLDDYVEFLHDFLNELDLGAVHLAGNSFGGKIGWNYALRHSDRVQKLLLVDSMGFMTRWPSLFSLGAIPLLGRCIRSVSPRWLIERFVASLYGDNGCLDERTLRRYYELFLAEGNREALHKRLRETIVRNEDRLPDLSVPTLIQWGTDDPLLPVKHANWFGKRIPSASVITYLGAGHMPMEERPEQTAHDARKLLKR